MFVGALGIRLVLCLGKEALLPAPYVAMTALTRAQVINDTRGADGFQLVFTLSKDPVGNFTLLSSGLLDPDSGVAIGVLVGAQMCPLIRGVIYHHQISPGADGGFTLTVMGRDTTALLDLEGPTDEDYQNQTDSEIVRRILLGYARHGLIDLSGITDTIDRPDEKERLPIKNESDLVYIRRLARRNGFVFYLESRTLLTTGAYWGPADRGGVPQGTLTFNLGPASNVSELRFTQDALAPQRAEGFYIDTVTKTSQRIPPPQERPMPLTRPVTARKTQRLHDTARLSPARARASLDAAQAEAPDAITAEGQLDTVRYGDALRAHQRVKLRGAGRAYDGDYEVRKVIHNIERGKYTQQFVIGRKGLQVA